MNEIIQNYTYALLAALLYTALRTFTQWIMVFRRPQIRLKLDKLQELEAEIDEHEANERKRPENPERKVPKRIQKIQLEIDQLKVEIQRSTMFINTALSLSSLIFSYIIGSFFENKVCIKFPFSVIYPLNKMTHKGLDGEDYTEGSFSSVFFLMNLWTNEFVVKLLNFKLPSSGMFPNIMNQMPMQMGH
ncbi:hypothetical protein TVAG_070920 [Trichomonas vaginalis G3]|uniref:Calcium load-activated calcium channel n=1 Tax=Trichomonas vaginalis (strain ATCC PRA-98 / G3) TaxID=412133 RepID=A2D7Z5_TRIV3|nr:PNAS-related family [Trichomonas vaginalis G3]EAY23428.1 hypothetical protein TVAG_070920 [Trichomonas vaginalis G3]KAI5493841.1 PNAS-related family [Trichomonas vaginalis G3]|eukprot:XP_001584414.1 hypothetical protein [Trichomonas vaginalis G3]